MRIFELTLSVGIVILVICMILIIIRFIKGPSLADRVVALDVFSATLLAVLAIYSVLSGVRTYLDVAIVLSLVTFTGTMAFAHYLIHEKKKDK